MRQEPPHWQSAVWHHEVRQLPGDGKMGLAAWHCGIFYDVHCLSACFACAWWTAFALAPFDCKYLISYLLAIVMFAFFEHLLVKIAYWKFDLENLGKGHGVQDSKWYTSMANINLYKLHTWAFFASSHRFWNIDIWNIWPWKNRSRSWSTTLALSQPGCNCQNL